MGVTRLTRLLALVAITAMAATANAAFIVEADNVAPAGKANDHFAATPAAGFSLTTAFSTAVGLTGNQSAFGNPANATGPDLYTFRYTPIPDLDNTVFLPGAALGTHRLDPGPLLTAVPQTASGLVGGLSGTYKVYITWPNSGNVSTTGSIVTVNSDGAPVVINPVNQNGDPAFPLTNTAMGQAGKNKWLNIGTVHLTTGTQYTVTMQANTASFVSQRVHGVMWELVAADVIVPEPATFILAGLGLAGVGFVARRRSA